MVKENAIRTDNHVPGMLADFGGETKRVKADEYGNLKSSIQTLGQDVGVQNPLQIDGDSVYSKDIWVDESTTIDWLDTDGAGIDIVLIPFTNLHTRITNSTGSAIKTILIHFNRTIDATQIGLGCDGGGNFSNFKVTLLGSGGVERLVSDDSLNDTKYTSKNYPFQNPELFNAIKLEFTTTDPVCLSNITIQKTTRTTTRLQAINPNGIITDIGATEENALKVAVEDQHFRPISLRMNQVVQIGLTLAIDTIIDSRTITMSPGHGLIAGNHIILLQENGEPQFFFTKIISVATDVLTLDTLVPYEFLASICEITQYDPQLNKDGSITTYKAELRNPFSFSLDITRLIMHMTDETAMDDGKFGGRVALPYGISLRKNIPGSGNLHFWNCKTNGNIAELSFDKGYDDKAPAGVYGFSARLSYAGQDKHGVAIKLDPGEAIELLIQDDLTLLLSFSITVEGHLNQ